MKPKHRDDKQYFQELAHTTRTYILPFIGRQMNMEPGMSVLEIGCGVGGNLKPFQELGCRVHGVDIVASKVEAAKKLMEEQGAGHVMLDCRDFLQMPVPDQGYDLIFLHDVIEHISDKQTLLERLKLFLKPEGIVYFAFPAWQMPFGGHQQICHSWLPAHVPFVHILFEPVYRAYLRCFEKNALNRAELLDIKRCKMTIEGFKKLVKAQGYRIAEEQLYLINPHYEIKFGLKPRKLPRIIGGIPFVRNFFSTSCFYIIRPDISQKD